MQPLFWVCRGLVVVVRRGWVVVVRRGLGWLQGRGEIWICDLWCLLPWYLVKSGVWVSFGDESFKAKYWSWEYVRWCCGLSEGFLLLAGGLLKIKVLGVFWSSSWLRFYRVNLFGWQRFQNDWVVFKRYWCLFSWSKWTFQRSDTLFHDHNYAFQDYDFQRSRGHFYWSPLPFDDDFSQSISPSFFTFVDPFKKSSFCFINYQEKPFKNTHSPLHLHTHTPTPTLLQTLTNSLTINK